MHKMGKKAEIEARARALASATALSLEQSTVVISSSNPLARATEVSLDSTEPPIFREWFFEVSPAPGWIEVVGIISGTVMFIFYYLAH